MSLTNFLKASKFVAYNEERERSIFFRGYRYTLQDQDTTWPAAYGSVRREHDEKGFMGIRLAHNGEYLLTTALPPSFCT